MNQPPNGVNQWWAALAVIGWMVAGVLGGLLLAGIDRSPAPVGTPALPARAVTTTESLPDGIRVDLVGVGTVQQVIDQIAKAVGLPVHTVWNQTSLRPEQGVRIDLPSADLSTTVRLLNASRPPYSPPIDIRIFADHVEIAAAEYFDRMETTAVNYDLTALVRRIAAAATISPAPSEDQVAGAIRDSLIATVTPDLWTDMGGDLARATLVGSGLLVTAPKRVHEQVRWALDQYEKTPGWVTGLERFLRPVTGGGAGPAPAPGPAAPAAPPQLGPIPPGQGSRAGG